MNTQSALRHEVPAGSLVATALLSVVSLLTMPLWPDGFLALLDTIEQHPTSSLVSALSFVLAQLPFAVGALAVARLLGASMPRLAATVGTLLVLGAFGHSVYGGVALAQLSMAADVDHHEAHAAVLTDLESGPLVLFLAMGLIGTVAGLGLMAIGLWRTRVVAAWIPSALGLYLATEFVGSNVTHWAAYASALLYLGAFAGLAVAVRSPQPERTVVSTLQG